MQITKKIIKKLYITDKLSVSQISAVKNCSENKINYWLKKYKIRKRNISEAVYIRKNPNGDPFHIKKDKNIENALLHGIGLGLYWGEGTKSNKTSIRVGNTDPDLIIKFIEFLRKCYQIDKNKLKYSLQIFNDMPKKKTVEFWCNKLKIKPFQLGKPVITPARSIGTYRNKTKYGVLIVYFNNRKLRDIICNEIDTLRMPL